MKIIAILTFLFLNYSNLYANVNNISADKTTNHTEIRKINQLKEQIQGDFRLFLDELYSDKEKNRKETKIITTEMINVLEQIKNLIKDSKTELKQISYSENRNLMVASIFLWISITIFIIMNLIFANNLKKELYFLRNGLLRSEIKDSMLELSKQLTELNEKISNVNNNSEVK